MPKSSSSDKSWDRLTPQAWAGTSIVDGAWKGPARHVRCAWQLHITKPFVAAALSYPCFSRFSVGREHRRTLYSYPPTVQRRCTHMGATSPQAG